MPSFTARELALNCARVVDQKGGAQVVVLQQPSSAHSFDYAVLVSASSDRLTNALVEEVWHFCKRHGVQRMPVEGDTGWMLIDCFDVVVHALSEEKRAFYQLDTLWPLAKKVAWEKEVKTLPDPDKVQVQVQTEPVVAVADPPAPKKRVSRKKPAIEAEPAAPKKKAVAKKAKPARRAKPQDAGEL
jgi:ribosome-associated protein